MRGCMHTVTIGEPGDDQVDTSAILFSAGPLLPCLLRSAHVDLVMVHDHSMCQ
jgi:riboflavin synthase